MKQMKDIAILTLLLMLGFWLCLSVSFAERKAHDAVSVKAQKNLKEQVNQEAQSMPTAWSEQTAPPGSAANPAEQLTAVLVVASCFFLLYRWKHPARKPFNVSLPFSSLTEQFRILPNAP